ncbi:MAG: ABC transporter ATP-binding protein [Deltaproteobacteria bacterium]|nr:ABC transporter ATP-binding protein [Deltaproteobacteria bacterium]
MELNMKKAAIEMHGYCFRVGRQDILKDISFTVHQGEYISVVGPNGAGKTTLLKCLNRIYTGGSGEVKVNGLPLGSYSQRELARVISYVPQANGGPLPFTVHEFVMMGRYPYLNPFSTVSVEDEEAVRNALELTGLAAYAERALNSLSGGERQKVFIAAALAQGAGILLLDEPVTFLDPRHQVEVHQILSRVNQESGVTIMAVTHDINNAFYWGERVLVLKEGQIAFNGPAEEIIERNLLKDIYGISFQLLKNPDSDKPLVIPEVPR